MNWTRPRVDTSVPPPGFLGMITVMSSLENSDSTEEAYWLGEEFRKETPLFPRDLYNNLPDLLNDCIIEDASDREQDISLLSDLTALSAVLPQTFGIYNHKKYSTHLFCVIFSSAGSGKSIAQTGRYLLEERHDSEKTTQIYLASLEASVVDKANKMILELL